MKNSRTELENKGYKIVTYMSGNGYQATKGNQSYVADSVDELAVKILGEDWNQEDEA